jgi:hypothetical protein
MDITGVDGGQNDAGHGGIIAPGMPSTGRF